MAVNPAEERGRSLDRRRMTIHKPTACHKPNVKGSQNFEGVRYKNLGRFDNWLDRVDFLANFSRILMGQNIHKNKNANL